MITQAQDQEILQLDPIDPHPLTYIDCMWPRGYKSWSDGAYHVDTFEFRTLGGIT